MGCLANATNCKWKVNGKWARLHDSNLYIRLSTFLFPETCNFCKVFTYLLCIRRNLPLHGEIVPHKTMLACTAIDAEFHLSVATICHDDAGL